MRQPGHPAAPAEIGGHLQGGGGQLVVGDLVLGGDGRVWQRGTFFVFTFCLGTNEAAKVNCRLSRSGFCPSGEILSFLLCLFILFYFGLDLSKFVFPEIVQIDINLFHLV